ncbi:MAG: YdcF family protein [Candidatus Nanopelagicaceae bacterium]|jgi:vancomycin permeability regulator SanA
MFLFKWLFKFLTFLLVLLLAIPTFALARTWLTANDETIGKADAIVVMGAAQLDGRPGRVLEARLKEVVRIYEKDFASQVFTLGEGAPGDRFTEAGTSRAWLAQKGIPWNSITAIRIGRDTFTSIEALASNVNIERYESIIIVTDPYHCFRSITMAKDFGFDASCSPVRTGIASLDKVGFRYLLRETGAYLAYITLGRRGIHISDHVAWKL